jgi:hypothetical protein
MGLFVTGCRKLWFFWDHRTAGAHAVSLRVGGEVSTELGAGFALADHAEAQE